MQNQSSAANFGLSWDLDEVSGDDPNCIVKSTFDGNSVQFFVKTCTTGPDLGLFYNPLSPTFDARTQNRFSSSRGTSKYEFKKVTENVYELYVQFIKTKNPLYCRQAERFTNG